MTTPIYKSTGKRKVIQEASEKEVLDTSCRFAAGGWFIP